MIPPRIFQTWKSKTILPSNFAFWSNTFKVFNPNYQYELWDDADNRNFIEQEFPWFLATYDAYPAEIYRADAVRYFYLYLHGGIYADMDTECLQTLDSLTTQDGVILGRMGLDEHFRHSIPNAIMAAAPKSAFWLLVFYQLLQCANSQKRPEHVTGPVVLKSAVDLYRSGEKITAQKAIEEMKTYLRIDQFPLSEMGKLTILDHRLWYPIDWHNPTDAALSHKIVAGDVPLDQCRQLFEGSMMVTYWTHTWE